MNSKDLPELNQPEENTAAYSEAMPPVAPEDTAQPGGTQENVAEGQSAEGKPEGGGLEDEINTLKKALEDKEKEMNELLDKAQRLAAEYDNYRKRTNREKERLYSDAVCDVVSRFLPVVDNLERALASEVETEEGKSLREGVSLILRQVTDILDKLGVKPIEAVGKTFDPELHNAVMHVEDENYGTGEIIEEFQKGYTYKDEIVIRHSMVKVAN